ncbi:AMP-binding protein [Streptococcus pneumoniae D39]|nr:AMP-binding protein [Streptococcus pneumoniae D39]
MINKDSANFLLNKLKNTNIANAYGMVETTAVCCLQYGRDLKNINSVGTTLPGVEVEVKNIDNDGNGDIWIKTNRFMSGYYPSKYTGEWLYTCLLYTSDAADEARSVDLGGSRINKKKKLKYYNNTATKKCKS